MWADAFPGVSRRPSLRALDELAASFRKKPDDLGERGAILPEKLMAAFEHAQGRAWDSLRHTLP